MTPSEKHDFAIATLLNLPEILRKDIVALPGFASEFNILREAEISFGSPPLKFVRSKLFSEIRALYAAPNKSRRVSTEDGKECVFALEELEGRLVVFLEHGGQRRELERFAFLSPSIDDRLREFDLWTGQDNIQDATARTWREVLAKRELADEELSGLIQELALNPLAIRESIRQEMSGGEVSLRLVVPESAAYFERLVSHAGDGETLESFVDGACREHIERLMRWDFSRGLSLSLLVAAHSSITDLIDVGDQSAKEVTDAFTWLADRGDRLSQIAGIELGVRLIGKYPEIDSSLIQIIQEIRDEDPRSSASRFALTSSQVVFVSGEMSRRNLLSGKPPFWRRLAAIAQASLVERELLRAVVNVKELLKDATRGRGHWFYMQAMADLRLEPRWLPDFISAEQLKDEAVSRLIAAGQKLKDGEGSEALNFLLKGTDEGSLRSLSRFPNTFLPGPLEGGTVSPMLMPADLIESLTLEPEATSLEASAFAGLLNCALIYRIGEEQTGAATEALRRVRHQVALGEGEWEPFTILAGLATVAAVGRATDLAEEVRTLARVFRRRIGGYIEFDQLMRVGLIAAAAHSDVMGWSKSVGDWLGELAREETDIEHAFKMREHRETLCNIVPELWKYSGKADAMLAMVTQDA